MTCALGRGGEVAELPASTLHSFKVKKTYIAHGEAFAVFSTLFNERQ